MTVAQKNLCMGCMSQKDYDGPCKKCGYQDKSTYNVDYLPPETVLSGRYLVGKLLSSNGESAVYIGYDLETDSKVWVRELMPYDLVSRNHSTLQLRPIKGCETKYKGIVAEFEDLFKTLQNLNIKGTSQVLDVFSEHSTIYVAFRYINSMTLGEILNRCGGEIKWANCKKTFMHLLNTVSLVHKKGLIHAGISPQTILIDEKGTPYLTCFAINEARSDNSDISCELFDGYSAPEQYDSKHWYGEWTDVYALAAVLYRTITGTMPPNSQGRKLNDNLVDAIELDENIPENVSEAIHDAMRLSTDKRTKTVDGFTSRLLDCTSSNTAIYNADMVDDVQKRLLNLSEEPEGEPQVLIKAEDAPLSRKKRKALKKAERQEVHKKRHRRNTFLTVFIPMVLTTIVLGVVIWLFISYKYEEIHQGVANYVSNGDTSSDSSSASASSAVEEAGGVPNFVGQYIDIITSNTDYNARFEFSIVHEYNDLFPEGVVYDQSPAANTPMLNKGTIILSVSKGSKTVKLPNLTGSTVDLAIQTLTDMELKYKVIYVIKDEYVEGQVAYTEPAADTVVNIGDEVLIFTKQTAGVSSSGDEDEEKESSSSGKSSSSSKASSKSKKSSSQESSQVEPHFASKD